MGFILCLKKSLLVHTVLKFISFTAKLRHLDSPWWSNSSNAWQELNQSDIYPFEQEKLSSLSSYLLPTIKKNSYLPYRLTIFHMFIEEIISPKIFVTEWTCISL